MNKLALASLLFTLLLSCSSAPIIQEFSAHSYRYDCQKLTPLIIMIGDGMGPEHIKAASLYATGQEKSFVVFDQKKFPIHKIIKTDTIDHQLTDSAAGGTRISTKVRTHEGKLAVDKDNRLLPTVLEEYQRCGFPTGVISTSYLLDATPASFFAHVTSRGEAKDILNDLFKTKPLFALGGGKKVSKKQFELITQNGFQLVTNRQELKMDKITKPVIGLFTDSTMSFESEKKADEPKLSELVDFALKHLEKVPGPFFLMIEGGRIDHAAHDHHLQFTVEETIAFMNEVEKVSNWNYLKSKKYQLVVTADHETGRLKIKESGGKGKLPKASFSTYFHSQADVDYWSNVEGPYLPNINEWEYGGKNQ